MRQFCFGTQARRLACLALVGFVGFLILPGLSTSANNSSRAVRRHVDDRRQDQQPEFVTNNYKQTNLVSDITGFAQLQDPLLINPWGLAQLATSPFWVANQASSTATLYGAQLAVLDGLVKRRSPGRRERACLCNGVGQLVHFISPFDNREDPGGRSRVRAGNGETNTVGMLIPKSANAAAPYLRYLRRPAALSTVS